MIGQSRIVSGMLTLGVFGERTGIEPNGTGCIVGKAFDFKFGSVCGYSERKTVVCPVSSTAYDMGGRQFTGKLFTVGTEVEHPDIDAACDIFGFNRGGEEVLFCAIYRYGCMEREAAF